MDFTSLMGDVKVRSLTLWIHSTSSHSNTHSTSVVVEMNYLIVYPSQVYCFLSVFNLLKKEIKHQPSNDYIQVPNIFVFVTECHEVCRECHGPNRNQCSACVRPSLVILNGECVVECVAEMYTDSNFYCQRKNLFVF